MKLVEVTTKDLASDFLQVHKNINSKDHNWICPLDKDINEVFDPKKNKAFRFGEVVRWVLFSEDEKPIGRIAAFISKKYKNKGDKFPVGCFGFFDCIDDQETARKLLDAAREWLKRKGVEAMDGPVNFGERDKWWGLLVDGFYPPLYGMNYNPPYYQKLLEGYGLEVFYNQVCWSMQVAGEEKQLAPRFYEAHEKYATDDNYSVRWAQKDNIDKLAADFCTVYNKAWAKHEGNKSSTIEQAKKVFKSLKPVLDAKLFYFAYYKNEPVAMWLNFPDLNQIFKRFNGNFNLLRKLQFLILHKMRGYNKFVGMVYGIVPEFQGTGVDYYMIVEAEKVLKNSRKYRQFEMMWIGDFNPKIMAISQKLGAVKSRRLITYRQIFDPTVPFERHPMLN